MGQNLVEKLHCCAEQNVSEMPAVFNELADKLLNDPLHQSDEADDVCQKIWLMTFALESRIDEFVYEFKHLYPDLKNVDDFKFILMKERYYVHFVLNFSDDFLNDHIDMLMNLLPATLRNSKDIKIDLLRLPKDARKAEDVLWLRTELQKLQAKDKTDQDVYIALMILAKYWPVNTEYCCSLEPLDSLTDGNRVFVSTGHHFNITSLKGHHRVRQLRDSEDATCMKELINPIRNEPFKDVCEYDERHLLDRSYIPAARVNEDITILRKIYYFKYAKNASIISNRLSTPGWYSQMSSDDIVRLARHFTLLRDFFIENAIKHGLQDSSSNISGYAFLIAFKKFQRLSDISIEAFSRFNIDKQNALVMGENILKILQYPIDVSLLLKMSDGGIKMLDQRAGVIFESDSASGKNSKVLIANLINKKINIFLTWKISGTLPADDTKVFHMNYQTYCASNIVELQVYKMHDTLSQIIISVSASKSGAFLFSKLLGTDRFHPFLEHFSVDSRDRKLLGFFFNQIIKLQPDLLDPINEICAPLSIRLEDAYETVPEWIKSSAEESREYTNTTLNRTVDNIRLIRLSTYAFIEIKTHTVEQKEAIMKQLRVLPEFAENYYFFSGFLGGVRSLSDARDIIVLKADKKNSYLFALFIQQLVIADPKVASIQTELTEATSMFFEVSKQSMKAKY